MSDQSQGPGWWQASDGRWYPPESAPGTVPPEAGQAWAPGTDPGPSWGSSSTPPSWGAPPAGYGYGYGAAGPAWGPAPLPSVNGLATASLVCGILGVLPCILFNSILAVVAVVLGVIAVRRISTGTAAPDGRGMAIAGIVLGSIGTVVVVAYLALLVLGVANEGALAVGTGAWS